MAIYEYTTTVQFVDINENNELTHKGLLRILGEAASIHSEFVGYGPNTISQTHLSWMVLHWKIQLFQTPSWNTKILVKTWRKNEKGNLFNFVIAKSLFSLCSRRF